MGADEGVAGPAVARIHPADVRPVRADRAGGVRGVAEVVVALPVLRERRVVGFGRARQRTAAAPAADELRRDTLDVCRRSVAVEPLGLLREERAKRRHVLFELAIDEIAAVARQDRGLWHLDRKTGFARPSEHELAGRERGPGAIGLERALAGKSGTPLSSIDGWPMPSANPKCSRRFAEHLGVEAMRSPRRPVRRRRARRAACRASDRDPPASARRRRRRRDCGRIVAELPDVRVRSRPVSPRIAARGAIPARNSAGKLSSDACGTPIAARPVQEKKTLSVAPGFDCGSHVAAVVTSC